MIKKGSKAPDFCLKDASEKEVCLKDYKGKWVVLYFYPKDNTPGCTIEARDFSKELDGFESLDAQVLGVSADSCESHRKFITKQKLTITLLSDEKKETLKAYGVWGKKSVMGKQSMGVNRTTFLIDPQGKVARVWEKVSVNGHAAEVKKAVEEYKK
ncbi:MAG: thioredoxin-dependent thiol peroxidase [Spirochaetia bacterium]|nr:thioredoxin-dependent thiol peroxidase [Spirochaetia bacterium]